MLMSLPSVTSLLTLVICIGVYVSVSEGYTEYGRNRERKVTLNGRKHRVKSSNNQATLAGQPRYVNNVASPPLYPPSSSHNRPWGHQSDSRRGQSYQSDSRRGQSHAPRTSGRRHTPKSSQPNILVILTDDQDVLLGSLNYMPKVQRLLMQKGAYFNNSFVPTPMCCPSRSTFLTGLYVHNHNVYTNNANCSGKMWQKEYESRSFATYINDTYHTAYFGKYLNEYDGNHVPPGWRRWQGLIKNSRFYNYSTVNEKGVKQKHGDNYYADYLTDLVSNDSISYLHYSKKHHPTKPLMMVLSVPAPHGPEDAAPQYQHMFVNNTDHRTPAWNHAPNPDKQWLLQHKFPMMPIHKLFTDLLQRRRLQTLQSVDDMVEKVVDTLDLLGELDNTYIVFTSDHGYHLGQFGLIKGKAMLFDFDTRVPLIIRGPGIRPGSVISNIVSNIDIAPTILDIVGKEVPPHMDGQSILRLIKGAKDENNVDHRGFVDLKRPWRDTILFERGKLSEKIMKERMRTEELSMFTSGGSKNLIHYIPTRKRKLAKECAKKQNRLPCKPDQKWYCIEDKGKLRKHKCRRKSTMSNLSAGELMQNDASMIKEPCHCRRAKILRRLGRIERKKQRRFLKRRRRDFRTSNSRRRRSAVIIDPKINNVSATELSGFESMFNRRCRILANQSVLCDLDIYTKTTEWQDHKERIDEMITEYRKALEDLRDIRRHLRKQRPLDELDDISNEIATEDWGDDESEDCDCDGLENSLSPMQLYKAKEKEKKLRMRVARKQTRKEKRKKKNFECNSENMNCFTHDNSHWKTPPFWEYGPFCFCSNANNNTYWCLRTINQTHDFVYCEFITTFMSYYDLITDPFQLQNTVTELNYGVIQQLHEALKKLKHCTGSKDCYLASNQNNKLPHEPDWAGLRNLRKFESRRSRYRENSYEDLDDDERGFQDNKWTVDRNRRRGGRETEFSDLDYE